MSAPTPGWLAALASRPDVAEHDWFASYVPPEGVSRRSAVLMLFGVLDALPALRDAQDAAVSRAMVAAGPPVETLGGSAAAPPIPPNQPNQPGRRRAPDTSPA